MLGALVGLGAAAFFVISEYTLLSQAAKDRAKKLGRKNVEFDGEAKKRMSSIIRFSLILPPALAGIFWIVLPRMGLA